MLFCLQRVHNEGGLIGWMVEELPGVAEVSVARLESWLRRSA
jgi:hypothetical protein